MSTPSTGAWRSLGTTGVQVSPLTLGAMMFGAWGNTDHDESVRIIHHALDAGINVIDTADVYARGESEEIVGRALKGRRDDVVLATKFHGSMSDDDPNQGGSSRRWIVREVENSLRRLQTDHIDLYQVHRPRPEVDVDETLGALSDLVHQGKIRYIGTSTFLPSQIVEAQWVAEKRHRERPVTEQPPYSILAREVERDVLPTAQKYGLGILPWSPLAGGWLSGRHRRGEQAPVSSRQQRQPARHDPALPENRRKLEAVHALQDLADQAGISLIHLALGFVLEHPAVSSAIIGPRTMEQLDAQLGVEKVALSPDVLDRIDEIVPPGTTLNDADRGYAPPSLVDPGRRRGGRG
jgi:aryl-alcohol dehydrogenase-like predicted oxidoreductase